MIPPVVMYVLGGLLALFGVYRLSLGRPAGAKNRTTHLVFGVLYILMGAYLVLTTARVIPVPRLGAAPRNPGPMPVKVYARPPTAPPPASQPR